MSSGSRFNRLIAVIVILSVCGFGAASLATLHYHNLGNGLVVAHSHPLPDDRQRDTHNHSQQQYAELNAASQLLDTMDLGTVLVAVVEFGYCATIPLTPVSTPVAAPARYSAERGPPCLSFS